MSTALPSLRQLSYLVALAERLNFTQAAQDCFVTQSTLSAGIQELERTLGVQLVERDRQHVLVTPLGRDVAARGRALLAAARDLVDTAAAQGAPMTGMVRLGAIPTVAPFLLPGLVGQLRQRHPALRLALREDQTGPLLQRLRSAELDFALVALPYDTTGLMVRPLFTEELWLVTPADGRSDRKALPPRLNGLDGARLLLLEEGHCLRDHALDACRLSERANRGGIEASSLVTLVQMVSAGLGDALVPRMAIDAGLLGNAAVRAARFSGPAPTRTIALLARPTTTRLAELEAIAAALDALAPVERAVAAAG